MAAIALGAPKDARRRDLASCASASAARWLPPEDRPVPAAARSPRTGSLCRSPCRCTEDHWALPPARSLRTAMLTLRLPSSTVVSGPNSRQKLALVTSSPGRSTSAVNRSNARPPMRTGFSPRSSNWRAGRSVNGPKAKDRELLAAGVVVHGSYEGPMRSARRGREGNISVHRPPRDNACGGAGKEPLRNGALTPFYNN